MAKIIIHQLSLTGIGGVQQSFIPYFKEALKNSSFTHLIYGMHELDDNYKEVEKYYTNINKSIFNKLKFIYFVYSKKYIVHFYNNLGSSQVNKLLNLIPSSNIIFHERGTIWNAKDKDKDIYLSNASKANIILANSNASKVMLTKRFDIEIDKIKVIHNGFLSAKDKLTPKNTDRYIDSFSVGYIGRLDTPKGVHIFIETAKKLPQYDFFIAGGGTWEDLLKKLAVGYDNIQFVGRVKKPLEFISKMDLIIVPSIREPLGNTVIEAGFCKKPVIASNVDGIAEIIEDGISGLLLEPKEEISITKLPKGAVPIPHVVVKPTTQELVKPKEISMEELCNVIIELEKNKQKRELFGNALFERVNKQFTMENYFSELEKKYKMI